MGKFLLNVPKYFFFIFNLSIIFVLHLLAYELHKGNTKIEETNSHNSSYIIGDLHGDVTCAKHWVEMTGLIDKLSGKWNDPSSIIIFMGDYVDKGPTSKQTVEYVKFLTDSFPKNVVALLGNHELELLLDREASRAAWDGFKFHQLVYAAAHPAEYLNYLLPADRLNTTGNYSPMDENVFIDALYNATIEVYSQGKYRSVYMIPDSKRPNSVLNYVKPKSLRFSLSKRLLLYQQRYVDAYRSGTPLGSWLESLPIAYVAHTGTLLVHGGVPIQLATQYLSKGKADVERINEILKKNTDEKHLPSFIEETELGQAIAYMLVYRGNHQTHAHDVSQKDKNTYCQKMQQLLSSMKGITRLGVGHTPSDTVHLACNYTFMALDSSLGRWIRATGNDYCRGNKRYVSTNGRFVCDPIEKQCHGQIVRIDQDGNVHIIEGKKIDDLPAESLIAEQREEL